MKPFFSIIIPTYNRAELIQPTLDSVLAQTFSDWECIVVDDGSTDRTAEVIRSYVERDTRFHYIYQDNAERSAARNNGIRHAKGEWICFLDSDDLYEPAHLTNLADAVGNNSEPSFFFCGSKTLHEGNLKVNIQEWHDNSSDYFIRHSVIPARVCIHHSILKTHLFDPEIVIVEDTVLWTQIHRVYPTKQLNLTSVIYRWHDDNSVNIAKNCFLPRLKGLQKLFRDSDMKLFISRAKRKAAISNCYYGIAKHHELKRNFVGMCWWVFRSLITDPVSPQSKAKIYMLYAYFR
jgi:glycosyltransferase involved in cell wall biosynthesis